MSWDEDARSALSGLISAARILHKQGYALADAFAYTETVLNEESAFLSKKGTPERTAPHIIGAPRGPDDIPLPQYGSADLGEFMAERMRAGDATAK